MRAARSGLVACLALMIASCSSTSDPAPSGSPPTTTATISSAPTQSALKNIDPAAFRKVVEDAAKKLMVPGAVVLVHSPQGDVEVAVGTTQLGAQTPPD